MEKVWFFVEGDAEENFIKNLIRLKYATSILLEKDLSVFVEKDISAYSHNLCYCENCHSVDKIPHRINDLLHLIEKSQSINLIIVCDVEDLTCFSNRRKKIVDILEQSFNRKNIHYVFFNPMIEAGYLECEDTVKRIIQLEYNTKFNQDLAGIINLDYDITKPLHSLKSSFKKYSVKYRESRFSEMFFPRVDYNNCQNGVLHRIASYLDHI